MHLIVMIMNFIDSRKSVSCSGLVNNATMKNKIFREKLVRANGVRIERKQNKCSIFRTCVSSCIVDEYFESWQSFCLLPRNVLRYMADVCTQFDVKNTFDSWHRCDESFSISTIFGCCFYVGRGKSLAQRSHSLLCTHMIFGHTSTSCRLQQW